MKDSAAEKADADRGAFFFEDLLRLFSFYHMVFTLMGIMDIRDGDADILP